MNFENLDFGTFTVEFSGSRCANKDCKHLPEYTFNLIGNVFHIKKGTQGVFVSVEDRCVVFCGGCHESLFEEIKKKLNPKLLPFR